GAALGNMTEAWWAPTLIVPGEIGEGKQLSRNTNDLRGLPGCIIVNRRGKRFAGEAINYNDVSKALMAFDPFAYDYSNVPCYLILDAEYRRNYTIATVTPDQETPAWLTETDSLRGLAERIGVDPDGLEQQVAEFNEHAEQGIDPIFHRGESAYDRFRGNRLLANPSIRPIGEGPYYALELKLGCLGTKGGPVINGNAQVLDVHEDPIPGLYAAGNVVANVFGPGYPGAGATLGSGTTFGYLAGKALTSETGNA
ncbi:MAG: FAD-binding protein, partial [Chloroflexi bacterium]|nr:FAD-binding protein [Chloroflexota bacterium]